MSLPLGLGSVAPASAVGGCRVSLKEKAKVRWGGQSEELSPTKKETGHVQESHWPFTERDAMQVAGVWGVEPGPQVPPHPVSRDTHVRQDRRQRPEATVTA